MASRHERQLFAATYTRFSGPPARTTARYPVVRAPSCPGAVDLLAKGRVQNRLHHLWQRLLNQSVRYRRDAELALASSGFGIVIRRTGRRRYVSFSS